MVKDKHRDEDDSEDQRDPSLKEQVDLDEAENKRREEIAKLPRMDVTVDEFRKLAKKAKWEADTIRLLLDVHPKALPKDYIQVGNNACRIV